MPGQGSASAVGRIRVLHLIHTMAYGGVETAVLNWIRSLDRTRFEVHLMCFANPGNTEAPFVEAAARLGIPVDKITWHRGKPLLRAARTLARTLRDRRIDILHAHNWYADFVALLAARMAPVKTITTLYVWFNYDWKRNLIQRLDQIAVRFFDRISAHCESTRIETIRRGIPPERVQTLICGFETHRVELSVDERARRRAAAGAAHDDIVLVNVARFYPEKAHVFLLESFSMLLKQLPQARLWIAGVGPLEAEVRATAERLGVAARVTFLGFVTALPELLALADLQVHPARIEGVPLAICEGMAAGLPIVASAVGGLPEVLADGRNGVLVEGLDPAAFVAAILHVARNPEWAAGLGRQARHFIENDYSLATAVARVERTYLDMLGPTQCA